MWLQRKAPGQDSTVVLARPDGEKVARRIAEAIHKLHRANVKPDRSHTLNDELRILHEKLPLVSEAKPQLREKIVQILAACDRLAASLNPPTPCGIHRDFYPAQVLVDGPRICLLDFDLYCLGDPALDIGNFIGHLTELGLRQHENPNFFHT